MAEIIQPEYHFTVDGHSVRVVDYCGAYVALLERMVSDYCQQHSIV